MKNLAEIIDQNIRARGLFRRGQKILVAVSGGVDSMALLHGLHELSEKNKWRLTIAHLNHRLRGRSSDADERLVVRAAEALGLSIVVERAEVRERAKASGLSLEMAAREARHEFLAKTSDRLKIPSIALAHHADDQVELFFVRLLRGSGSEGLAGMQWRNLSPFRTAGSRVELVRPLLDVSKGSLREYAREKKIQSREDASNASMDILRNRIRHELLPLLRRKYQPALNKIILRLMEITGAEAEITEQAARKWLAKPADSEISSIQRRDAGTFPGKFEELPVAIQRRVLHLELRRQKVPADFALAEHLRKHPGDAVSISPEVAIFRDRNGHLHLREMLGVEVNSEQTEVEFQDRAGQAVLDRRTIRWVIHPQNTFHIPAPRPGREIFDADQVGSRVILRRWRPGDRFQPIGMSQAVKLQDLFTNKRVPRAERHKLLVATTAKGELFWVEGLRISEQFKLRPNTRRRLTWRWK